MEDEISWLCDFTPQIQESITTNTLLVHIVYRVYAFCRLTASRDVDKPVAADTEFVIKLVGELKCCLFDVDLNFQISIEINESASQLNSTNVTNQKEAFQLMCYSILLELCQ